MSNAVRITEEHWVPYVIKFIIVEVRKHQLRYFLSAIKKNFLTYFRKKDYHH